MQNQSSDVVDLCTVFRESVTFTERDMRNAEGNQAKLNEDEIFIIFDVVSRRGKQEEAAKNIAEAGEKLYRRGYRPHRITIARVYKVAVELFNRKPDTPLLTTEEADDIAGIAGYGVSANRVFELQRLHQLWQARERERTKKTPVGETDKSSESMRKEEPQKRADTIYESHARVSIKPPIRDPHRPMDWAVHKHNEVACILNIKSRSILIESLQTRTSDVEARYQVMLFESDPRRMTVGVEQEDMIQMNPVTQRIYTYPTGSPLPYANRYGEKKLYIGISVYSRNTPIDFLSGRELNDKQKEFLERAIDFTLTLRYRVI